jgi:glycosyltransferase involved in cell wall biosynthesis
MRIAQVAPLYERVPPRRYGGTERVVGWLTEELVRRGHDVTLFATADSETSARLEPCAPGPLRDGGRFLDATAWHTAMLERVASRARSFDVVHVHLDHVHLPLVRRLGVPTVTTLHGRLDLPGVPSLYELFPDVPLVSISHAQRAPLRGACWMATIHHGLPLRDIEPSMRPGEHLAYLGRFSVEKGAAEAIEIAERAGLPLRMAGNLVEPERAYFESEIAPRLAPGRVELVGEVDDAGKGPLLAGARALVFPIDWPEPFGLVMIEALARGTPVIAFRRGSVPEVIQHGVTGLVVDDVAQAVKAVQRVHELDRGLIRAIAERRFSVEAMTTAYLRVYRRLAGAARAPRRRAAVG